MHAFRISKSLSLQISPLRYVKPRKASSFGQATSSPLLTSLTTLLKNGEVDMAQAKLVATLFARAAPRDVLVDGRREILKNLTESKMDQAIAFMEQTRGHGLAWTGKDLVALLLGLVHQSRFEEASTLMMDALHGEEALEDADKLVVRETLHLLMLDFEFGAELVELETPLMQQSAELLMRRGKVAELEELFADSTNAQHLAMLLIANVNSGNVQAALDRLAAFPEELQHTGMSNIILEAIAKKKLDFSSVNLVLDQMSTQPDEYSLEWILDRLKMHRNPDGSLHHEAAHVISKTMSCLSADADLTKFGDASVGHVMEATSISNPTNAQRVWNELSSRGYRPTSRAYNHLLQSLLKANDVDAGINLVLTIMPRESLLPSMEQIGLIVLYLRHNDPTKVDDFLTKVGNLMGADTSKQVTDILSMLTDKTTQQ